MVEDKEKEYTNSEMFVLSKVKVLHIMRSFKQSDDLKHIHIAGLNMRIETPKVFGVEVAATGYADVDSFKHYLHTLQKEYEYQPDQITFVILRDVHELGDVDSFVDEFQSLLRNARSRGIHLVLLDDVNNRDISIPGFRVIELGEETIFEKMFEDLADVIIFVGESVRDCAKSAIQSFSNTEAPVHKTGIRLEHLDRNATEDISRLLSIYDIAVKQFAVGEDVEWTVFTLNDSERVSDSVHALLGSLSNVTYIDNTDDINSCIEQLVKSIFRHEVDEAAPTQLLVMGSESAEYMLNAQRIALASLCAGASAGSRIIPLFVNCDSLVDEITAIGGNRFMVEV